MRASGNESAKQGDWRDLPSIASLTPTVCRLLGLAPPTIAQAPALDAIVDDVTRRVRGRPIERCLIYCPDALGEQVWRRWPGREGSILRHAPLEARLLSVEPPKTPVCYASIFTGAPPDVHGIRSYDRPVLRCDTLFDALLRSGRRVAIAAVEDSSIDRIFRDRDLRYRSGRNDAEVTRHALDELISDSSDVIVAYHQEYDDMLHATEPFSEACSEAMMRHLESFDELCDAARSAWRARDALIAFVPDHGAHVDLATGNGTHGDPIPEDLLVRHWYGALGGR